MNIDLPPVPQPLGAYVAAVRTGNLLFVSGMLPIADGRPILQGRIGGELTIEQGQAAVVAALRNGLAVAAVHAKGLENIRRVVRMSVYQRTTESFADHAVIADAASVLLRDILGPDRAGHARLVFGVLSLPREMPVEIELILELAR